MSCYVHNLRNQHAEPVCGKQERPGKTTPATAWFCPAAFWCQEYAQGRPPRRFGHLNGPTGAHGHNALGDTQCYARPTEPRFSMRIFTILVISAMPAWPGFLGSKQVGFSAM